MKIDRYVGYYERTTVSDAAKDLQVFNLGEKFIGRIEECNRAKFRLLKKRIYTQTFKDYSASSFLTSEILSFIQFSGDLYSVISFHSAISRLQ